MIFIKVAVMTHSRLVQNSCNDSHMINVKIDTIIHQGLTILAMIHLVGYYRIVIMIHIQRLISSPPFL